MLHPTFAIRVPHKESQMIHSTQQLSGSALSSHDPLHSGPVNARQMEPSSLGSSAQCHVAYINGSVKSQHRIGALCYADETSLGYADETSLAPDLIFSARCGSVQFGRMK